MLPIVFQLVLVDFNRVQSKHVIVVMKWK